MSNALKLTAVGLALAAAPLVAQAQPVASSVKVEHPWIRPNPPGAPTAAGYLTIVNSGRSPDRLLGGSSPDVGKIEVHQMTMEGSIMKMRALPGGLAIPPGATVRLQPGGYHLMLIGPKRAFKAGERIPVTLTFQHAGALKAEFAVQMAAPAENATQGSSMSHMDMPTAHHGDGVR